MNTRVLRSVCKAGSILHRRTFTLYAATPRIVPTQFPKPLLTRVCAIKPNTSIPSRWLSSTSRFSKEAAPDNTDKDWRADGVYDVEKWNKLMDQYAEESESDQDAIVKWAELLEEGVAAKLPDIEGTIGRNCSNSEAISTYVDEVLEEDNVHEYDEYDEDEDDEYLNKSRLFDYEGSEQDEDYDEDEDFDEDEDLDEDEEFDREMNEGNTKKNKKRNN